MNYSALHPHKISLACAGSVGVLYIICVIASLVAPETVMKLTNIVTHLISFDSLRTSDPMAFGNVILGLALILVYSYVGTYIFAWMYNKLLK